MQGNLVAFMTYASMILFSFIDAINDFYVLVPRVWKQLLNNINAV